MTSGSLSSGCVRRAIGRSSRCVRPATLLLALLLLPAPAVAQTLPTTRPSPTTQAAPLDYRAAAAEVMRHIHKTFYLPDKNLYAHSIKQRHPDFMWGNGVMFTALLGAARDDPATYRPRLDAFFKSMDRYWDAKSKIPGYEPSPTKGNGNDKYYDDNAWMVIMYVEAFELTNDRRYLDRAEATLAFVLSGWDDRRGGGIWWHEKHKAGTKNTCANAPAAVGCLRLAAHQPPDKARESIAWARRIVEWTTRTLQSDEGLFIDNIRVDSGQLNHGKLTYNTALMTRAYLGLHRATGDETFLNQATRTAKGSEWFRSRSHRGYRDPPKWSHLLVEADLDVYRTTRDPALLRRAANHAEYLYETWQRTPPDTLIDNAAVARALWLMADVQAATRFDE
jgi:hypothetical protein